MKKSARISYLYIIGFLTFIPYLSAIFFIRSDYNIVYIFVSLICFFTLLFVYILYIISEKNKNYKYIILVLVPLSLIVEFVFYGSILSLANYYDYYFVRKDDLADLLEEVRNEEFSSIYSIRREMIGTELMSEKLLSPKIPDEKLRKIREKMEKYKFYYIHKDGSLIYFTNSGFIDSEGGYVFNEKDEFPKMSPAGKIHTWEKIDKNWYYWYAD